MLRQKEWAKGLFRCGTAALAVIAGTAHAQEQAAPAAESSGIADIVVSAQRYEQRLQETPLSVVAVGAEQLESMGVSSLNGFDTFIPNVSIGGTAAQGNAIANFAIRGIGGAPSGFVTQESAVGVYIDDILFARPNGALLDLLDVERVEVLRGPQGTLFGRNTAGGAIRYVTKKPSNELEGNVKVALGSRNRRDISGTLNLPLMDTVAARLSFSKKNRDGFVKRVIDGDRVGDENSTTMRAQLRWRPTDRLDINLSVDNVRTHDDGTPTVIPAYSVGDLYPAALYRNPVSAAAASLRRLAPLSVSPSGYTNAASDFAFYTNQLNGRYSIYGGPTQDLNKFKATGFAGTLAYDLTDDIVFKSLTGYRDADQIQRQDWDRTPIPLVQLNETIDIKYLTQEFQLTGNSFDNRFKWVTGVFYYWDKAKDYRRRYDPTGGGDSPSEGTIGLGAREEKFITTKSLAAFAQGTFAVTDRLSTTVGLRWNKDKKDYTSFREGRGRVLVNGVLTPMAASVKGSWSNVSPRVGIDYRWTNDVMTYVSAAKGFKGGGFNDTLQTTCSASPLPNCGLSEFKPENLWTYEIGLRSDLFDRKVRFNVTGFYTKYKDQQIQLIDPGPPPLQYTINGDSTVKGVEVEFMAAPVDSLLLRANLGYVDAGYDQAIPGLSGRTALTKDTPYFRSPKWSYSLGATYTRELRNDAELAFDVNWGWKSSQASYPNPTNMVILPSYGLLNGRIEYKAAAGWSLALVGTNLLDKYYLTGGFDPAGPSSKLSPSLGNGVHDAVFGFTMWDLGRRREFGVELKYNF